MKKYTVICVLFVCLFSCKKTATKVDPVQSVPNGVVTINIASLANAENDLQEVTTYGNGKNTAYKYGSFDGAGKPLKTKELLIHEDAGDTTISIFFDDSERVNLVYLAVNGVKQSAFLTMDYSDSGKILLNTYTYDWGSNIVHLATSIALADSSANYAVLEHHQFKTTVDAAYAVYLASVIVSRGAVLAATTALGCELGGIPGCAIGGVVGLFLSARQSNADETVTSSYSGTKPMIPVNPNNSQNLNVEALLTGGSTKTWQLTHVSGNVYMDSCTTLQFSNDYAFFAVYNCSQQNNSGSWSISNNILHLVGDFKIISISPTTLHLQFYTNESWHWYYNAK